MGESTSPTPIKQISENIPHTEYTDASEASLGGRANGHT